MKIRIIIVCIMGIFCMVGCMKEVKGDNSTIKTETKVMQETVSVAVKDENTSEESETIEIAEVETDTETDEEASVETNIESKETLITKEEKEQLEYWLSEYQPSSKATEEDLLQLRGNLELDMDEACYPELRESLERHGEQLQQRNDINSYQIIVHRADKNVLGFLELQSDTGNYNGYNFDTVSGKALSIYDVISDMDTFSIIVAGQLQRNYPNVSFVDDLANRIKETLGQSVNSAWTMEYQGISCFFTAEVLGCDTNEILQVMITFTEIPELIAEQYQQIPEAYAVELNENIPFIYDLDGDGSLDTISIYRYFNDEEKSTGIQVNEQICIGKFRYPTVYGENSRAYLVHMAEHKNYVIFYEEGEWDCSGEYAVYTAENSRIEYIGCESIYLGDVHITNPGTIKIKNSTEPLLKGILQTEAYGFVTESGFLQADHLDYYYLDSDRIVKTLVPLNVLPANPYTSELLDEEINLPVGSYMKLLRTDLETWCDFVLADGQVCRLIFDEPASDIVPKHDGQKVLGECLFLE